MSQQNSSWGSEERKKIIKTEQIPEHSLKKSSRLNFLDMPMLSSYFKIWNTKVYVFLAVVSTALKLGWEEGKKKKREVRCAGRNEVEIGWKERVKRNQAKRIMKGGTKEGHKGEGNGRMVEACTYGQNKRQTDTALNNMDIQIFFHIFLFLHPMEIGEQK